MTPAIVPDPPHSEARILCGLGGGITMVPAFVMQPGLSLKQAVATSLTAIIPISLLATAQNHSNNLASWPTTFACTAYGGLIVLFSADLLKQLGNPALSRMFALLMIGVGVQMLFQNRP